MQFVDMHCDSLMQLFFKDRDQAELYESKVTSVDFKRMRQGGQMAQFFAIFMLPPDTFQMFGMEYVPDWEYIEIQRSFLMENLEKHSELIALATNAGQISANWKSGKMSTVLTMEDGRTVEGKMENLERLYRMDVRALSLTWNEENCFGSPNSKDSVIMQKGLTDFGKEAVRYMQEMGMLVDVSHLSDGGFYDVASICHKPFVATHSNCRELCPHPRNLTDDMIRLLGNAGGVSGINFGPEFLNPDIECKDSTAALMAEHARHMADVGGIDCVGIGTDFDGVWGNLEIADCSQMSVLESALQKKGFSGSEIEKIFYKNVLRVIEESMR